MDNEKFSTLMYALTKNAASERFLDFLEEWDISIEEYNAIRNHLAEVYGVKTYV